MENQRRFLQLGQRRKDKLRQVLEHQYGEEKILIIEKAMANVDQLFDQGLSFTEILHQLQNKINQETSNSPQKFPAENRASVYNQQQRVYNDERKIHNDYPPINKSYFNHQQNQELASNNSFVLPRGRNNFDKQSSERSLSEWDEYDEMRSRFELEFKGVSKNFEEIQKKIVPAVSPFEYKAKQDELKALEAMKIGQAFYKEKEIYDKMHHKQVLTENREALLKQMREKQEMMNKQMEEDKIYGMSLAERKKRGELNQMYDKMRNREKQREYYVALKNQVDNKEIEKKKFDALKEELRKVHMSNPEIGIRNLNPIVKDISQVNNHYSPIKGINDSFRYNPASNYSFSTERSATPGRSGYLAHYGSHVLHN
ncbi:unnamed protein product [Blepharisma stoltei]|uniref:Uncharacterized protein n=1 Tax=Blepharisma stoltei TaxID=1481888 RepID=A0AAU9JWU8_9CILI|nr:unnamed protein product [Blepharisma stoltei]